MGKKIQNSMYNTMYTNFKIHNSGFLWEVERELGRHIKGACILKEL